MNAFVITLPQLGFEWLDEDTYVISKKFPIYAVADGVTLSARDEVTTPEGSRPAAELFSRKSVEFLEEHYDKLSDKIIREAYAHANAAVAKLNKKYNIPLSTVGSLVAVKDGYLLGSRITDCGFAIVRAGTLHFKTPEYWAWQKRHNKKTYGVIDGKAEALEHIDIYRKPYKAGDVLILFSDGFENHFKSKKFVAIFRARNWVKLEAMIKKIDTELVAKDAKYGHERTLIAVLVAVF